MCTVAEEPTTDDCRQAASQSVRVGHSHLSPRQRKEIWLPRVVQLALEGHSGRAIAQKVGMPRRTVDYWLRVVREEWLAKAAAGTTEVLSLAVARLEAIYREAMEAWRDSQAEIAVRLVEESEVVGANGLVTKKKKTSVRTQRQRPNAALLTKAMEAVKATCLLTTRAAESLKTSAGGEGKRFDLETLKPSDLHDMSDEEIAALKAQVEAEFVAGGGTIPPRPTDAELQAMSDEELDQREALIRAEIAKEEEEEAARESPRGPARGTCPPQASLGSTPEGVESHVSSPVFEGDTCPMENASSIRDVMNGGKEAERGSFWAKRAKIPHR